MVSCKLKVWNPSQIDIHPLIIREETFPCFIGFPIFSQLSGLFLRSPGLLIQHSPMRQALFLVFSKNIFWLWILRSLGSNSNNVTSCKVDQSFIYDISTCIGEHAAGNQSLIATPGWHLRLMVGELHRKESQEMGRGKSGHTIYTEGTSKKHNIIVSLVWVNYCGMFL